MSAFDGVGDQYDSDLQRGIGLTGEGKEHYARGRVAWAHRRARLLASCPRRVIDYGCGNGDTIPILEQAFQGAEVFGVEPSSELAQLARDRQGRSRVLSPQEVESRSLTADLVYCNGVLHHVPLPQRPAFLRALWDALRPGGCLTLFENNPLNPGTQLVMSRIPFDRDAKPLTHWHARRILASIGFETLGVGFLFIFPSILSALRPLERHLESLPLGGQYGILARRSIGAGE